jgi:hypothetical protein
MNEFAAAMDQVLKDHGFEKYKIIPSGRYYHTPQGLNNIKLLCTEDMARQIARSIDSNNPGCEYCVDLIHEETNMQIDPYTGEKEFYE